MADATRPVEDHESHIENRVVGASLSGANVRDAITSVVVTNACTLRVDVAVGPDNPVLHSADTSKCGFVMHRWRT